MSNSARLRTHRPTDKSVQAAPFHPKGMQPRASCPVCLETGDDGLRDLYAIRGLGEGEYDEMIPHSWMQCPPIKLDGTLPGMEAVRVRLFLIRSAFCSLH